MNKYEQIEKVVSLAKSYVGTSEDPKGSNRNRFAKMIDEKFPDFYNGKKNGSAWCDEFVDAIFLETFGEDEALRLLCQPKKSCGAGCKFSAQYYKQAGRFFDKPEVGDQIFFYVGGDINHTGIVTKVDAKKVYTTEGNSGDMVKDHSYNKEGNKKIAGYGRPKWNEEVNTAPNPVPVSPKQEDEIVNITMPVLQKGSRCAEVGTVQTLLNALGFKGKNGRSLTVDRDFGQNVDYAVRLFQKSKDLTPDGIVGSKTWKALLTSI